MSSSSEHKKKHDHKKVTSSLPPDMVTDGGFTTRIHGVPGSTPGCTAGAYARPLGDGELPEITVKTCFPDHYTLGKKWFTEAHPKSLQLLLTGFGPAPSIADMVNKWLIRRVSRKCAEGTEEGRKDMEAFCVDAVKRLRKLPTCTAVLYRACPWSAMGNSAPGLSELEEECDVVWPTFASLTKSEKRARQIFKEEGGILFVVSTDQARDVSDIAPVQNEGGEFMLEPNSTFTITENKQEEKVFVVKMKQNYPSLRPILKDVVDTHKHGHHAHGAGGEKKGTLEVAQPTMQPRTGDGATIVTPVLRRAPSMPSSPITRKSSLNAVGVAASPLGFGRSSSRVMISTSPFGKKTPSRAQHRVQANMHSAGAMTMWSASCSYIKVYSPAARGKDHIVKPITPDWTTGKKKEEEKKEEEKKDEDKEKKKEKKEKKEKKDKKKKDKEKEKKDAAAAEDTSSPPLSPTTPGDDSMVLCPTVAPTYVITESAMDWETLGGIIQHMPRSSPRMVMSLRR